MSIRARLLWLVAIATLVPAILLGLRFFQERASQIETALGQLAADAGVMALDLDGRIQGTAQLLFGLARARDLETTDRAACSAFLAEVRAQYPQFTGILTIDPGGRLFCDSLRTGRELDLNDRDYFRQARALQQGVALEPAFGRLTGMSVLQVAYPFRTVSDGLRFVLLASLNLAEFVRDHPTAMQDGREVLLLDAAGMVLAWSAASTGVPDRRALIGTSIAETPLGRFALAQGVGRGLSPGAGRSLSPGAGRTTDMLHPDGSRRIWATVEVPRLRQAGIHLLLGQSRGALVAEANLRLTQDFAVTAAVALLLAVGVWLLGEIGIRRQVGRIAAMASRLGQGDLAARIPTPHPGGELGGLMTVLNRAAESLEHQRDAIADLNRKLLQSQRMEAVGQLTGGLAHDFNNLLTVILGSAELLEERLAHDDDLRQLAETMREAAERGGDLTRSLLAFARRQPLAPRRTDVGAEIRRLELLLRRTAGDAIECRFNLPGNIPPALVDPAQLEAALLNLVLNARDAMPDGGLLTVETAAAQLDASYAESNEEVLPGDYVAIAITDTGRGMTPEVLAQAFEPFFTTKEFGKGSGLGLSMVYGFVKQSRGHAKIYSEPGQGTTVKLYLPRAEGAATTQAPPPALAIGGTESVLVVEDNDMVRVHVISELSQLGYRTLSAPNGAMALEILRGESEIDVLFTDVVMPGGMSGPQLAASALLLRPELKVLYTSGYTENSVVHHGRLDPGVVLLSKPYRRQELAEKLRQVLDAD